MRKLSPEVQILLSQDSVTGFFLVQWGTGIESYALRHTSFPYNLTITDVLNLDPSIGVATFYADNGLSGIDAPRLSDTLDREIYKITYIDNDMYMLNLIRSQLKTYGAPCKVWIGLLNTTSDILDGYGPGEPLTDLQHCIMAYKGVVDTYGVAIDTDGVITTSFDLSSPMAALDMVRPQYTSPENVPSNDHCFDQMHTPSAVFTMHWGKIA